MVSQQSWGKAPSRREWKLAWSYAREFLSDGRDDAPYAIALDVRRPNLVAGDSIFPTPVEYQRAYRLHQFALHVATLRKIVDLLDASWWQVHESVHNQRPWHPGLHPPRPLPDRSFKVRVTLRKNGKLLFDSDVFRAQSLRRVVQTARSTALKHGAAWCVHLPESDKRVTPDNLEHHIS